MSASDAAEGPLTPAERRELLRLAREAVASIVGGARPEEFRLDTPRLLGPAAVFVSLHVGDELRGCVGTLEAERPLRSAVVEMARAAAREDPRFPPIRASELPRLDIEISRLGRLRRVSPDEVVPGRDGLYVARGGARGILLPQVAARLHWTREDFLSQTCRKAGLRPQDWQDPQTLIYAFTAEVFGAEASESCAGGRH